MLTAPEYAKPLLPSLAPYLEDLEARIEPAVEERLWRDWIDFQEGRFEGRIFHPRRPVPAPPRIAWPERPRINQTLDNRLNMALYELRGCSDVLAAGAGTVLNVRANYGTGILPSTLGAQVFVMDDNYNTLPTTWPLKGGADGIRAMLARGAPSPSAGLGGATLAMGREYVDLFKDYPKIRRWVQIYHPDLQSPMDVTEMLWGSGLFLDLFDFPELAKACLEHVTAAYISLLKAWLEIAPFREGYNAHWGLLIRGTLMLRDDSAMNLSPDMYEEFIRPYDQRLLKIFGGGAMHYCGRGDHFVPLAAAMPELTAVNLSQPHLNDMEAIFKATVDHGVPLLGLSRAAAEAAFAAGRELHGRVHTGEPPSLAKAAQS